jgi:hypothetical protein
MTNSIFNEQVPAVSNQDKESINNQYYTNDISLKTKGNAFNRPMNYSTQSKIKRSTTAYNNYRPAKAGRASVGQNSMVNASIYNDEYTNAVPQHNYSLNVRLANSSSSLQEE